MILIISISLLILLVLWILSQTNLCDWLCSIIVSGAKRYRCRQRPKRIILIRHGESQANQDSRIYSTIPDHAIGLTEKGQEQAQTCELICEAFSEEKILKIREDPRIREQEWGNFQDLAKREITVAERQKIGRFFYRFGNGESGADVYDRVSLFMDSLFREMDGNLMPNSNILIVSHGLFMRLFLMRFYRWSVERFHTLENFNNCGYCILERDDQDGSFILKTELKISSEQELLKRKDSKEKLNEQNLNEEINSILHTIKTENDKKKA
ncbi:unnamed protein product [Rotaria sp. Silwood1]|nr:unnamed protein product [Rotaria sp. Silwood1]